MIYSYLSRTWPIWISKVTDWWSFRVSYCGLFTIWDNWPLEVTRTWTWLLVTNFSTWLGWRTLYSVTSNCRHSTVALFVNYVIALSSRWTCPGVTYKASPKQRSDRCATLPCCHSMTTPSTPLCCMIPFMAYRGRQCVNSVFPMYTCRICHLRCLLLWIKATWQQFVWGTPAERPSRGVFCSRRQISKLDLGANKITKIEDHSFDCLLRLSELNLDMNRFVTLGSATRLGISPGLSSLSMTKNSIMKITQESLLGYDNLTMLRLTGNNIGKISPNVFVPTPRLKVLQLSDNKIQYIPPGTFDTLTDLIALQLRRNFIQPNNPSIFQVGLAILRVHFCMNTVPITSIQIVFYHSITHAFTPDIYWYTSTNISDIYI